MISESACISVIIPCYNVQSYIIDCLDSVINQSCLPKEIICIDDGSTDDTLLILQQYASTYGFIKIIQQTNHGVSIARNKGFEIATGDYIFFLDSDDILNTNLFSKFKLLLNSEPNLEFFYFDHTSFENDEKYPTSNQIKSIDTALFQSGTSLLSYLLERKNYSGVVWRYIFKRDLFEKKFIGKFHEDHLVSLSLISKAKIACYCMTKHAYFHRIRISSLSAQKSDYLYVDTLKNILIECIKIINELPLSNIAKRNYILVMNVTYLESLLKSNQIIDQEKKESIIKDLGLLKILIRIYINNKPNVFKNICYLLKYIKQNPCSISKKKALLKCALTKQYPSLNIKNNYIEYSTLHNL